MGRIQKQSDFISIFESWNYFRSLIENQEKTKSSKTKNSRYWDEWVASLFRPSEVKTAGKATANQNADAWKLGLLQPGEVSKWPHILTSIISAISACSLKEKKNYWTESSFCVRIFHQRETKYVIVCLWVKNSANVFQTAGVVIIQWIVKQCIWEVSYIVQGFIYNAHFLGYCWCGINKCMYIRYQQIKHN